jgi:hypothetical protein
LEGIDLPEVKLEEEAVVAGDPASEGINQLLATGLEASLGNPRTWYSIDHTPIPAPHTAWS